MTEQPAEQIIKVADILSDREVAITAGALREIVPGTFLRIISGNPHVVRNPDTGESLGEIVRTKAVVRVYEAADNYALARTFRTRSVNTGGHLGSSAIDRLFSPPKYEKRVETLRRNPDLGEPIDPDESVVEIGDIAEVIDEATAKDLPSSTVWR